MPPRLQGYYQQSGGQLRAAMIGLSDQRLVAENSLYVLKKVFRINKNVRIAVSFSILNNGKFNSANANSFFWPQSHSALREKPISGRVGIFV